MMKHKRITAGIVLGLLGLAVNSLNLEIFFNIDLLFGSIFIMLAILCAGTVPGVIAGILASIFSYITPHHPLVAIIYSSEAIFVAWSSRKSRDVLTWDIVYWFLFGAPLSWLLFRNIVGMPVETATLIMFKQLINGIFNALLATIVHLLVQVRMRPVEEAPSFQRVVFVSLVSLALLPTLLLLLLNVRSFIGYEEQRLTQTATHTAAIANETVSLWVSQQQQNMRAFAELIGNPDKVSADDLQKYVELLKSSSPAFSRMAVLNRDSIAVANSPLVDERGGSTLGLDFSDRSYIAVLNKRKVPYISDLIMGRIGVSVPILPFLVPLVNGGSYDGCCVGVVQLEQLERIISSIADKGGAITLLDRSGRVIVSTRHDLKTMMVFNRTSGGEVRACGDGVYHLIPARPGGRGTLQRWKESVFVKEVRIGNPEIGWSVIAEVSALPLLTTITNESIRSFSLLSALVLIMAVLSHFFSKGLTGALLRLQSLTQEFPQSFKNGGFKNSWPQSRISEVNALTKNFKQMADTLRRYFSALNSWSETLEKRVIERTKALARSEERFRRIADAVPVGVFEAATDGSCRYFNERWLESTGLSLFQAIEGGWVAISCPDDRDQVVNEWHRAVLEKKTLRMEFRFTRSDGSLAWGLVQSSPMHAVSGEFCGFIGTITDITDFKQREELAAELEAKKSRLRDMEKKRQHLKEKDMLVKDLHDGIGGIVSNISMLAQYGLGRMELETCRSTLKKITELAAEGVDEVRSFMNSTESGESAWSDLLAEIKDHADRMLSPHQIQLDASGEIDLGLPPIGSFRYLNILRISKEMVTNIIKHAQASRVSLIFRARGELFQLCVTDNGVGFDSSVVKRRGLANMLSRANDVGGNISMTSSAAGTTLNLVLPLKEQNAPGEPCA